MAKRLQQEKEEEVAKIEARRERERQYQQKMLQENKRQK